MNSHLQFLRDGLLCKYQQLAVLMEKRLIAESEWNAIRSSLNLWHGTFWLCVLAFLFFTRQAFHFSEAGNVLPAIYVTGTLTIIVGARVGLLDLRAVPYKKAYDKSASEFHDHQIRALLLASGIHELELQARKQ